MKNGPLQSLLFSRVSAVWLILVILTLISFESSQGLSATVASVAAILIAMFKMRLVGIEFMALREAPTPLRLVFEAWVLVLAITLVSLYLYRLL